MARGAFAVNASRAAGAGAACAVLALVGMPVAAVALRAEVFGGLGWADWAAIRFTLLQAALSALISVALAVPLARALARRAFPGRGILLTLLGAPFILPVIVAIFGLLAVFGSAGLLGRVTEYFGMAPVRIFGLQGVVLAHVFFNLPLATRLVLQGWAAIPSERFRLAASLGMGPTEIGRFLERPMLWNVLPGAVLIVFVLSTTSFAVALALGGGPRATTIELAIYQAFRFDFDLGRAALLALVQVLVTTTAALAALRVSRPDPMGRGLDRPIAFWLPPDRRRQWLDAALIALAGAFLLVPVAMVVFRALPGLADVEPRLWEALGRSVAVSLTATVLMLALAVPMVLAAARTRGDSTLLEITSFLGLAVSPLVIGTGLYILLFPIADPIALALPITAALNAVMALPFALRVLLPAARVAESAYGALADMLGLQGAARLKWLYLPRMRRPLGFAAGLTAALAMGDLGVVALFAAPERGTLPLEMYRLMAAYRMDDAAAAGAILTASSLAMFWLFDRGGRLGAAT